MPLPPHAAGPAPIPYRIPSVHPEGIKFVAISAGITLLAFAFVAQWLGWVLVLVTAWVAAFFRDPVRVTPAGEGLIVSPADGLVCQIAVVDAPRQLLGALPEGPLTRVSVFMSVFDVHINRAAIGGIVRRVAYVPGKFVNADLDKASEDNERNYLLIEGSGGQLIGFTQIAGLVARRIMCFVKEGDLVAPGQRIGLIRFGSRVDVFVPVGFNVQVAKGQRAIAGETIIARPDVAVADAGPGQ
jgi:phosphatidylserine decarboxylase